MPADIILIRHGRSTWNDEGRCQGNVIDPPLNFKGRLQAQIAAGEFEAAKADAQCIYSSDQRRALETAETIASRLNIPVYTDVRLREMGQGQWQGLLYPEIIAKWGDLYKALYDTPFDMCPPGGETMGDVARRVFAAMDDIAVRHSGRRVILVSHEMPIAIARCAAYSGDLQRVWDFGPHNCEPSRILWPLRHPVVIPDGKMLVSAAAD